MKSLITVLLLLLTTVADAQNKKTYIPAWTHHKNNIDIYGLSVGISGLLMSPENTNTYGVRLSAIGEGLFIFMLPESPVVDLDDTANRVYRSGKVTSERITGLNLSASGTMCRCNINGISAGLLGHISDTVHGITTVLFQNYVQVHNGVQLALIISQAYKIKGIQLGAMNNNIHATGIQLGGYNKNKHTRGLQIGGVNKSKHTRGVQIGLWNINEHRKLPLVNWNFRDTNT